MWVKVNYGMSLAESCQGFISVAALAPCVYGGSGDIETPNQF